MRNVDVVRLTVGMTAAMAIASPTVAQTVPPAQARVVDQQLVAPPAVAMRYLVRVEVARGEVLLGAPTLELETGATARVSSDRYTLELTLDEGPAQGGGVATVAATLSGVGDMAAVAFRPVALSPGREITLATEPMLPVASGCG